MTLQLDLEKYANSNAVLIQIYINRMVLGVSSVTGQMAESASFSHPRSLLGNYSIAEDTLTKLIKQGKFSFLDSAPIMFIQAIERTEAG